MPTTRRAYLDAKFNDDKVAHEFSHLRIDGLVETKNPWGLPKKPYAERAKPQYESSHASDFVYAKDLGKGLFRASHPSRGYEVADEP